MAQNHPPSAQPKTGALDDENSVQAVPALDRLAALVARLLRVPLALVSLVEVERQKFPGMYGVLPEPFDQRQTPISHSFCQRVFATGLPLVVRDARLDERVACNPAVADLNVIAYLGMPLVTTDGEVLGSLCAIDSAPRDWTQEEQTTLRELVGFAVTELEAQCNNQRLREAKQALTDRMESERDRLIEAFRRSPSFVAVLQGLHHLYMFANDGYCQLVGRTAESILQRSIREVLPEVEGQGVFELLDQVYATGKVHVGKDVQVLLQSEPGQPPVEHFIDFVFQPTRGADGRVDGIFVQGVDWTERKRAQQEADRASEQVHTILESVTDGFYALDAEWRFTFFNETAKAHFLPHVGSTEALLGKNFWEMFPQARDTDIYPRLHRVMDEGVPVEYEAFYPPWQRWYAVRAFPIRGGGLSNYFRDITEEKRAHEKTQESEAKYRSLFDSIDEAFAVLDIIRDEHDQPVDYRFVEVNPAFERHTGWDDARGRRVRELVPNLEDHWPETYGKVERTGESVRFVQGAEGMGRVFDAYAFRVGSVEHPQVAILFQDVTGQRAAAAELVKLSEQRGLALDSAQMGWWHYDPTTQELEWDERSRALYGYTVDQVNVTQALGGIHPDDRPARDAAFQAAMRPDTPHARYEAEYRVQQPDGSWRWVQVKGRGTFTGEGAERRLTGMDGTLADVTAAKEAQDALRGALADRDQLLEAEQNARADAERTSRIKDEFLATLSHELRTPLNAILGWTQVLRGDPANTEDMEAGLATIERNSRAQNQIIEDLLDMSKIISGKVRLDVQPLHLDQVITAAVETMRPAAAAKHIRLQTLIDPQARMISGDPNRLQQVFWNLLSNAIKFTPKEGKVQVVLERVNSHLEISIADTGEGIAPKFLPYVFDRFRQQDASTTRRHGGLGLGLAIVKQLVELHGGSIRVESEGAGKGTTFKVLLPLSVVQPAPGPDDSERRHPQSGGAKLPTPGESLNLAGVKVLVVDDEADARALVQRLLEDRGALVQSVGGVPEAIELLQAQRPDVLVSDIGMPEEDGYALIRQVRALPPEQGGSTPALALTAYARSEDRTKVILAGFQMHLAKPVEAAEMLALVASLSGRVAGR